MWSITMFYICVLGTPFDQYNFIIKCEVPIDLAFNCGITGKLSTIS